ncbi:MAG: alpha/beta fold hydrolase [Trueperaceae bacterium]|nr:alpha/beta fold hydrolase [Trueperaceae bacterium]
MPKSVQIGTLEVAGATIHYETRGSGPVLLLIPGGPADAGVFGDLARELEGQYMVVTYDPRGNSRSRLHGPMGDQDLDVHADDAARLIEALSAGPAYVMGNSGGAQIGLNLAARHPGSLRALVAHEPPCVNLLPDPTEAVDVLERIYRAYGEGGVEAGIGMFMQLSGLEEEEEEAHGEPSPDAAESFARIGGNLEYFLAHGMRPLSLYLPDVSALRRGPVRVVVGVGESTQGQTAHNCGLALAERLGVEPVAFPGGHGGFESDAAGFATLLDRVLRA